LTNNPASGSIATPIVKNVGKKALTAISKAYANSTRESRRAEACEVGAMRRRFVMVYMMKAVRRPNRRKSPIG
jgi:hypothetical protein